MAGNDIFLFNDTDERMSDSVANIDMHGKEV